MKATSISQDTLNVRGMQIPYVDFENEDDVTTQGGELLSSRLEAVLGKLYQVQNGDSLQG